MFYEKKVGSYPQLIRELDILDLDAGIRVLGKYKGKKCFIFITRSANGFTSILYGMKRVGKENIPDKRLLANDFKTLQELEGFLPQFVSKPIVASVY